MPRQRLSDNSVLQLVLAIHLALLVLLACAHRMINNEHGYGTYEAYGAACAICGGVFVAQLTLIASWAAFGRSVPAIRAGALVLFVPLLAAVQSQVFNNTSFFVWWHAHQEDYRLRYAIWVTELGLWALIIAVIGFGLRCAGLRLVTTAAPNQQEGPWHFRLFDIVGWVFVVGLALTAGRWLREYGWVWWDAEAVVWAWQGQIWAEWEFFILVLLISAGVLYSDSLRVRWGTMLIAPLLLSLMRSIGTTDYESGADALTYYGVQQRLFTQDVTALMYYVFTATFGGTLLVVRDRGYRLRWRRPWSSPPVADSP